MSGPWLLRHTKPITCYNFSYSELWLLHIYSSSWSSRSWLNPYDILTPSPVSFTALYCGAQSAQSPFRLFFSRLLSLTDCDILCLTHNPQTIYYINPRLNAVFFSFDPGNLPSSLLIERSQTKCLEEDLAHQKHLIDLEEGQAPISYTDLTEGVRQNRPDR